MKTLIQANDPVLIGFAQSLLAEAGIDCFVADTNISIMEGSIGVFPRRILVLDDDEPAARRLLTEAGLGHELVAGGRPRTPSDSGSPPDA